MIKVIKGLWHARQGINPAIDRQEIISNNIANAGTPGFKKDRLFVKLLEKETERIEMRFGTDFRRGATVNTGKPYDLSIEGEKAFFAVSTPNGERYTRNGSFTVNANGELSTGDGYPVLSDSGPVPVSGGRFTVRESGRIIVDGVPVGRLKVVDIPDTTVLLKEGNALFRLKEDAAAPDEPGTSIVVRQGYIEESNVNPVSEMVSMIESFRLYEANQKAGSIQDESVRKAVGEVGAV